jgi:hypothetical protein
MVVHQGEAMKYKYLVQCWITPRSGFDIVKKNRITELFRSIIADTFSDDKHAEESVKNFERSHEGLVLEPLVVESDTVIVDAEKEILPEIQKTYPGAIIFSCEKIPELVVTESK